ncbi:MAG: hypothetical protein LC740_01010 [Actinobacteria bacterium]|nr:hypothetical protein [Actinomycetota bacterium]
MKYVGKPPPRAQDAGLAHDLDGLFLAQGLYLFEVTLLHLSHDLLPHFSTVPRLMTQPALLL